MSAGVPVFSRQYVGKNIPNFMELPCAPAYAMHTAVAKKIIIYFIALII